DIIKDDIHAALAGELHHAFRDIFSRAIDGVIRAHFKGALEFSVVARSDDGTRADLLDELQRGQRHPATYPEYQYRIPWLELGLGEQHAPGGEMIYAQRGGFGV